MKYHICVPVASEIWYSPLPLKNKKHHKSSGSSNFELSFHPHYVISLPFNIFQRDFCVDGSLLQITRGAVKILKWNTEMLQVNKALRYQSSIKASGCCCGVSWWADTLKRFKRSLNLSWQRWLLIPSGLHRNKWFAQEFSLLLTSLNMLLRLLPCCPDSARQASIFTVTFKPVFLCKAIRGAGIAAEFTQSWSLRYLRPHSKPPGRYDRLQLF